MATTSEKSLIIIGAGIAGLATGCYAQMNGYRSQIVEMHSQPGGLCTSWKRKGYTFDGCIHWLVGSSPSSSWHRMWQELGAVQGRPMVDHEFFLQVFGPDDQVLTLYTDADQLEQHLKEISPADARTIGTMCSTIRRLAGMAMPLDNPTGLIDGLRWGARMLPLMGTMKKWSQVPTAEFAEGFRAPFLREAFARMYEGMGDMPAVSLLMTLAWMHNKDGGYPLGGSLAFAQAIEERYRRLGGEVHYRARVDKIVVEGDRAVGVRLADSREHRAGTVISCADGHATIFDMLEGKYLDDTVRGYYERLPLFPGNVQVSLGVARDLSAAPHTAAYPLPAPVPIAGRERQQIGFRHFCYDPTMAPPTKSAVVALLPSDYCYWQPLAADRARYEAEKEAIGAWVIAELDRLHPGIAQEVEVVDVATPLTTERYTGNWQGAMEGWLLTAETMRMKFGPGMSKTLPGLEGFYMAGQWVEPGGGVPAAAFSARNVVKMICQRDGVRFATSVA